MSNWYERYSKESSNSTHGTLTSVPCYCIPGTPNYKPKKVKLQNKGGKKVCSNCHGKGSVTEVTNAADKLKFYPHGADRPQIQQTIAQWREIADKQTEQYTQTGNPIIATEEEGQQ